MSAWQPIETAPKDGTTILVYQGSNIRLVKWGGWGGGVWVCANTGGNLTSLDTGVTHWRSVPQPPSDKSKTENGGITPEAAAFLNEVLRWWDAYERSRHSHPPYTSSCRPHRSARCGPPVWSRKERAA